MLWKLQVSAKTKVEKKEIKQETEKKKNNANQIKKCHL